MGACASACGKKATERKANINDLISKLLAKVISVTFDMTEGTQSAPSPLYTFFSCGGDPPHRFSLSRTTPFGSRSLRAV